MNTYLVIDSKYWRFGQLIGFLLRIYGHSLDNWSVKQLKQTKKNGAELWWAGWNSSLLIRCFGFEFWIWRKLCWERHPQVSSAVRDSNLIGALILARTPLNEPCNAWFIFSRNSNITSLNQVENQKEKNWCPNFFWEHHYIYNFEFEEGTHVWM